MKNLLLQHMMEQVAVFTETDKKCQCIYSNLSQQSDRGSFLHRFISCEFCQFLWIQELVVFAANSATTFMAI